MTVNDGSYLHDRHEYTTGGRIFTKSERVDYIKRLLRIEQAKAKERQNLGQKSDEGSRADEATAEQFGISRDTMRRELFIADNKDLLDPADLLTRATLSARAPKHPRSPTIIMHPSDTNAAYSSGRRFYARHGLQSLSIGARTT